MEVDYNKHKCLKKNLIFMTVITKTYLIINLSIFDNIYHDFTFIIY